MGKTKFDNRITELMNLARAGKITVGGFAKRAEEHYGVKLPELTQNLLSDAADFHYLFKQSGLTFNEYARRVGEILDVLQILDKEHINERYAKSGLLTI